MFHMQDKTFSVSNTAFSQKNRPFYTLHTFYIITHITVVTFRRHMKVRSGGAGVQTWAPPTVTLRQTTFISERLKYV